MYRQITISITAPHGVVNQDLLNIEVGEDLTIADLKAAIQSDTNVLPSFQQLFHNGVELRDDAKTLQQCQIQGGNMLGMMVLDPQSRGSRAPRSNQAGRGSQSSRGQPARAGQEPDWEMMRLRALGQPGILAQFRNTNPDLADAVSDPIRFREVLRNMQAQQAEAEFEKQRELTLLNADPFNPETQAKIEEAIRQERVMENLQDAMDYTPEGKPKPSSIPPFLRPKLTLFSAAFGRVHMLYIPVEVNNTPIKAFVDSGAQATIMSPSCAENCNIMRLIDKRYAGIARGVGTANILGRVHSAQIKIGNLFFPCSFTVMEGKDVDLLLGLDMLKRHQACIDLNKGALVIRDEEVRFLGEADIPKHGEVLLNEPTIKGPGGMITGAISGAVSKASDSTPSDGKGKAATNSTDSTAPSTSTANQPALTSSSTTTTDASSAPTEFPAEAITKLMEMGFSRERAIQGLQAVGGNVGEAANLLLLQE